MTSGIDTKTLKCVRCGFCLDSCPTFRVTGNEADSPRGRIYLMRSVQQGDIKLDEGVRRHIDSCLGCRACETACPSGVEYGSILEEFRNTLEQSDVRPPMQRAARKQLLNTLTSPIRMSVALKGGQILAALTGQKAQAMPRMISEILTGQSEIPVTLPAPPDKVHIGHLPTVSPAVGKKKRTVGILPGCVMRVMFHETNLATVRVLQENGCEVIAAPNLGCCGALHLHSGYHEEAMERARQFMDVVSKLEIDAFVVNSAGCGSTLKEYGSLFEGDDVRSAFAVSFAGKTYDVSEYLSMIDCKPPKGRIEATVAYHDACHLAHAQKVRSEPRSLLKLIPGLKLVEIEDSDTCCGSAGIYNLTQPAIARALLERKVDSIIDTGAEIVATGNPGCLAWIEQGLAERGKSIPIVHPVQLLDRAYSSG